MKRFIALLSAILSLVSVSAPAGSEEREWETYMDHVPIYHDPWGVGATGAIPIMASPGPPTSYPGNS